ncbi:MAG: hypothetical protein WDZ45_07145 [Flavobacteriaceae bacterium]
MKARNLLLIIPGILLLLIYSGCSIKDELTNKKSFVIVELAGPLKNGSFKIETGGAVDNFQNATGLFIPNEETNVETALLTFQDFDQDLSVGFAFPAKKGLNELLFDEIDEYISITFLNEELILVSKQVSLNITKFKKKESSLISFGGSFEAKGTFTGIVVYVDSATNEEYTHILTGEFEYNPI